MKELTTEVYGLNFGIKGNRICFITHDVTQNKDNGKHYWVTLGKKATKDLSKLIEEYIKSAEEYAKLSPQEQAEFNKEFMGS